MPNASAANAPCVLVCESPHTTVMPGKGRALLRPDHMHDALAHIGHLEFVHAELGAIVVQRLHLQTRDRIGDALRAPGGRHVVIGHGQDRCGAPQLAPGQLQSLEGLRAGHFMHQMAVDIDQRGAVGFLPHHVGIPEFVVKSLRFHVVPLAIPACLNARLCHNSRSLAYVPPPGCAISEMDNRAKNGKIVHGKCGSFSLESQDTSAQRESGFVIA